MGAGQRRGRRSPACREAGSIDIITRAFAGLQRRAGGLAFAPGLPPELRRVQFGLQHHDHCMDVTVDHDRLRLATHPCAAAAFSVEVNGTRGTLHGGQVREFDLAQRALRPVSASGDR